MPVLQLRGDDSHALQHVHPGFEQILLLGVPANENGRRQLLRLKDDDHVISCARYRKGRRLVGHMEELQRVARHLYLETAVDGGNRPDLKPGHANLHILNSLALFVYNPSPDGNALLRRHHHRQQQRRNS